MMTDAPTEELCPHGTCEFEECGCDERCGAALIREEVREIVGVLTRDMGCAKGAHEER
jgi:hypothetical protein